ncbi:FKBP-type peptidyl-prolyl cis-trans isomerase [Nonomuraea ferruginea]
MCRSRRVSGQAHLLRRNLAPALARPARARHVLRHRPGRSAAARGEGRVRRQAAGDHPGSASPAARRGWRSWSRAGGRETAPGDVVLADVELRLWRGNQTRASTYGTHRPIAVVLDGRPIPRVWREAVVGRPAGSRMLLVGPAAQVLGPDLDLDAGDLPPGEPLVAVVDILGGYPPDARLVGLAAALAARRPHAGRPGPHAHRGFGRGRAGRVEGGGAVRGRRLAVEDPGGLLVPHRRPRGLHPDRGRRASGWVEGLRGQRVGGRVAFGSPPEGLLYVADVVDCVDC